MEEEKLKSLVEEGLSTYAISRKLGCSQSTVRYYMSKYSLKTSRTLGRKKCNVIHCVGCAASIINPRKGRRYCSIKCQQHYLLQRKIEENKYSVRTIKRHLINTIGVCSICEISDWNSKPIILGIDHIDGNSENNDLSNLRLVCPNCHSQTDTYKNKNKGNGRFYRRLRYNEKKSF